MAIHGCSRIVAFRYAARENVSCPAGDLRELSQLDATLVSQYVAAMLTFATGRNGSRADRRVPPNRPLSIELPLSALTPSASKSRNAQRGFLSRKFDFTGFEFASVL
jgi:hypothetical protein